MIHRLAISIGTIAAAAVLALGFAATGFGPAAAPVDAGQLVAAALPAVVGAAATTDAPKRVTKVETETVYVKPAPKRKVIHVTKREPAPAAKRPKVKVVHVTKVRPAKHAEHERDDEHENEHEDDD